MDEHQNYIRVVTRELIFHKENSSFYYPNKQAKQNNLHT